MPAIYCNICVSSQRQQTTEDALEDGNLTQGEARNYIGNLSFQELNLLILNATLLYDPIFRFDFLSYFVPPKKRASIAQLLHQTVEQENMWIQNFR